MEGKQIFFKQEISIPLLSSPPSGNPLSGFVYLYGLTTDKHIYQKDENGVIIDLGASGGGGGGGLTEQQVLARVFIN